MTGGKPFQSKLAPHYELIARLRKKHTPYPEIARLLHEEHGLKVASSTIFEFVKVRARRSGVFALPEIPGSATPLPSLPAAASEVQPAKPKRANSTDTVAAAATPALAAKKYVFTPKPKATGRFADEDLEFNDPLK